MLLRSNIIADEDGGGGGNFLLYLSKFYIK